MENMKSIYKGKSCIFQLDLYVVFCAILPFALTLLAVPKNRDSCVTADTFLATIPDDYGNSVKNWSSSGSRIRNRHRLANALFAAILLRRVLKTQNQLIRETINENLDEVKDLLS